jgi:PAS domain S-box-containing protein
MATLRHLGSEPTTGRDDREYLRAAVRHLEGNPRSLPFSLIYLFDEAGEAAELVAGAGIDAGHPAAPARIALADEAPSWPVSDLADGRTVVVTDLQERFAGVPTGAWLEPPSTAVLLPLPTQVRQAHPYGFVLVAVNRYRPLDDGYLSFLGLVAAQLASGVAGTRAYAAERRRAEELAELDQAKTTFFTNVSHELRTPLTLLLGPAEDALADTKHPLAEAQRQRVEIILRNGQRLLKLVNTLLDFSSLESGRARAAFEPVDVARYTAQLASTFEAAVQRAGLAFEIDCERLPKPVYVDREMWAKIVLNLLSNALKYTLAGTISVRVHEADGRARLEVSDTGIGIDLAEQAHLFERFHRILGARGRTHEGSGIGLALVAELAELHGGRPGVRSDPGRGSTFSVELPFGSEHLPAEQVTGEGSGFSIDPEVAGFLAEASRWLASEPAPAAEDQARRPPGATPDRPRILVVDDNADMRDYVATVLADHYAVTTAPDGEIALKLATADAPDLVLTDVMMPRLDGFGLLAALHADPATMHIPVVMLSARAGEDGVIEGLEAGADDYLAKPFSARELVARVRANLELDRARRTRDELQRSQSLLTQAERLAAVGSWEVDLSSGTIRGSDQLLRLLGYTRREFSTLNYRGSIAQMVHPDDRASVREAVEAAIHSGVPLAYEARLAARDGAERWIRVRGELTCDEQGNPRTLRGFMQDISQQRRAEQALAAAAAAREAAEREHRIADALQRSLLPGSDFASEHMEVATYYQAGVEGTRVGGDWYDAIDLGAGRTALVIGDVAGRGVRAASVMGQLRAAVRAYARLDLPPAEVLELLDAMVRELAPGQLVTCIYGVFDPTERELRYANAGHLPPLLALPGQGARRLPGATGPPLGVGSLRFDEHRQALRTGAVVAFYTDGLVERRDRDLDVGIDALAAYVNADGDGVGSLPGTLVHSLAPAGSEDDIAILIARIGDDSEQRIAELDLPSDPSALRAGRRFATATLLEWSVPEAVIEDAALVVSELITNAIVHGRPPIRLRLLRTPAELALEVDDDASAMPRRLRVGPEAEHGRGLSIVADLSSRWAARANGHGKTVWSTLRVPRPEGPPSAASSAHGVLNSADGHDSRNG